MIIPQLDTELLETAFDLCERQMSHDEFFGVLKNGSNDVEKQICILRLNQLNSLDEASLLVFHLTNHDGKIREVTALKLCELADAEDFCKILSNKIFYKDYVNAICDVNANICRMVVELLSKLPYTAQCDIIDLIFRHLKILLAEIFEVRNKKNKSLNIAKHLDTKKLFNCYWCLEAISNILNDDVDFKVLKNLINLAMKIDNYTIKEKIAKILNLNDNIRGKFSTEIQILSQDENFYVKRFFK